MCRTTKFFINLNKNVYVYVNVHIITYEYVQKIQMNETG